MFFNNDYYTLSLFYSRKFSKAEMAEKTKRIQQLEHEIASIGNRANVDSEEFTMLWRLIIDKKHPVIDDAFKDLLIQAKLIFSVEIGEILIERQKQEFAAEQLKIHQNEFLAYRIERTQRLDYISEKIQERKLCLLRKIQSQKCKISDFKGTELRDAKELLQSGHLKNNFFRRLTVKNIDSYIPTSEIVLRRYKQYLH